MLPGRVQTILAGASALIKRLCDELGLAEILDAAVRWEPKPCKLSPGTRIVALLFGPGVQAEDFTDDALARALDDLVEADPKALFAQVALRAVLREGIEEPLPITRGYSHPRRRDLKQIVFGVITHAEGFPVHAGVHDGNLSHKTWNRQVLESFESVLAGCKP